MKAENTGYPASVDVFFSNISLQCFLGFPAPYSRVRNDGRQWKNVFKPGKEKEYLVDKHD